MSAPAKVTEDDKKRCALQFRYRKLNGNWRRKALDRVNNAPIVAVDDEPWPESLRTGHVVLVFEHIYDVYVLDESAINLKALHLLGDFHAARTIADEAIKRQFADASISDF